MRKFRLPDETRSKGKRGGLRIFFLVLPHVETAHILFVLKKGEAEDLAVEEKKVIKALVTLIKKEAKQ